MGEYSFELSPCLSPLPVSPKYHGQLSTSKQKYLHPIKLVGGTFVQVGTLANETKDKDVLNWFDKDEEQFKAVVLNIKVTIE